MDEVECHWASFPFFLCGETADYQVVVRALIHGDDVKVEEEFEVCGEHAITMASNAIATGFHFSARPLVPVRIEWSEPEDDE